MQALQFMPIHTVEIVAQTQLGIGHTRVVILVIRLGGFSKREGDFVDMTKRIYQINHIGKIRAIVVIA